MTAIPLPLDNARKFFRKAQKGSRGLAMVEEREREIKGRLDKLKWVMRLRFDVNSNYIKPGAMVAHARAASLAKQIKQSISHSLSATA